MIKRDYCPAEQAETVCYHKSIENCHRCRMVHEEIKELKQRLGIKEKR